jgi:hypothetical protein
MTLKSLPSTQYGHLMISGMSALVCFALLLSVAQQRTGQSQTSAASTNAQAKMEQENYRVHHGLLGEFKVKILSGRRKSRLAPIVRDLMGGMARLNSSFFNLAVITASSGGGYTTRPNKKRQKSVLLSAWLRSLRVMHSWYLSRRYVRTIRRVSLALLLLILTACGGGKSSSSSTGSALPGNWQFNLVQEYPRPQTPLSVSGFLTESGGNLTGSVQVPPVASHANCGGVSTVTGTLSGQSVTLAVNEGGTTLNLSGTMSADGQSMTGSYQGPGGSCFTAPTTGTWSAFLIPPLDGSFTGTLTSQDYMTLLTGVSPAAPITVSGSFNQSGNAGASNATLTGTITAVGYPCFSTATMTGTISGQNVYLDIFDYKGNQIGTLGQSSGSAGTPGSPATVVVTSGAVSLVDTGGNALFLGEFTGTGTTSGPCPPVLNNSGSTITFDNASVTLNIQ